ncbi:ATP-binding protein [Streptomyces prunicolor]|uniref:sensor histidine kinase n=1 Tax=Streptomyces prunicolor TaxID=67348 RepID=UPI00386ED0A6|nr:ATP-binding protein [Streptomyces prunicolor]
MWPTGPALVGGVTDRGQHSQQGPDQAAQAGQGHGLGEEPALGLSIVRQLIDAHRGTATVTGVPGTKTVFTVRLPAPS